MDSANRIAIQKASDGGTGIVQPPWAFLRAGNFMRTNNQMELTLDSRHNKCIPPRRSRQSRSRWWLEQMKLAAQNAVEWQPATPSGQPG
jgi:hypothetical protein